MLFRDFWFSYKNILLRQIIKKKYLNFLRKIFGSLYKFILRYIKHTLLFGITNLDNPKEKYLYQLKLDDLFIRFNCDKGPFCIWNKKKVFTHKYSFFYEKYFSKIKNKKLKILELGSHEGRGIASFYYYFSNAHFYGANINPFQMIYKSDRVTELFVDVASEEILNNLAHHLNYDFDIIIDDASHNLRDILITFPIFFKKLKTNGVYVIEDLDQFHIFKELNPYVKELTPKEILLKIKNKKNFQSSFINTNQKDFLMKNIKNIYLEKGSMFIKKKNVSDIAFIEKK
tara:strand:+ start:33 stop:890 length:858 start_codon:yes stop_codon:yes gene_type:complete